MPARGRYVVDNCENNEICASHRWYAKHGNNNLYAAAAGADLFRLLSHCYLFRIIADKLILDARTHTLSGSNNSGDSELLENKYLFIYVLCMLWLLRVYSHFIQIHMDDRLYCVGWSKRSIRQSRPAKVLSSLFCLYWTIVGVTSITRE